LGIGEVILEFGIRLRQFDEDQLHPNREEVQFAQTHAIEPRK
jgi:hypothetical protein